ncbi:MAG: response regulator [Candidatus Riflebacteria bacterium]|nr:response regulator [Candidatus Riflebacteria bacterium]
MKLRNQKIENAIEKIEYFPINKMNFNEAQLRRRFADRFLRVAFIFMCILLPVSLLRKGAIGFYLGNFSTLLYFVTLCCLYFFKDRISPDTLVMLILGTLLLFLPMGLAHLGPLSVNMIIMPIVLIYLRMIFGQRWATIGLVYIVFVFLFFAFLFCTNHLSVDLDILKFVSSPSVWFFNILTIIFCTVMFFLIYAPAELAIMEKNAWFTAIFNGVNDSIFIRDAHTGTILDCNQRVTEMFGYSREEVFASPIGFLSTESFFSISKEVAKKFQEALVKDYSNFNCYARRKDGNLLWVECEMRKVCIGNADVIILTLRDISFRKKLEEQLLQAKKMESIGRLAGGISHDFNNLLTPIMGFSELLLKSNLDDSQQREMLELILKAASRARDLICQLLAFSRKQKPQLKPVALQEVLKGIEQILRQTIREDIHIEIVIQPFSGIVRADVGQIEQIIMNLALNARDAMPKGGTLSLGLSEVMFQTPRSDLSGDVLATPHVMLSIKDSGHGMKKEVLQHMFEPFFTTKANGTGLGLSMVYGIVKQHGGHILAESNPNEGTTFFIYLPTISDFIEEVNEAPGPSVKLPSHPSTIMIVEDEEMVRRMIQLTLTQQGYKVFTAGNAAECLECLDKTLEKIDILLTDVTMPGMNGIELYEKLCERFSTLRVLYISGYDPNIVAKHGILGEHLHFLPKPFTTELLCAKVRETIES